MKLRNDIGGILKILFFPLTLTQSSRKSHWLLREHLHCGNWQMLESRAFCSPIQRGAEHRETMHLLKETEGGLGWNLNWANFVKGISDGATLLLTTATASVCGTR